MSDDDIRSFADERRRLMDELDRERRQLLRNIGTCRIREIDRPFIGEWSLKDIVGHVASWEAEVVTAFREIRQGLRPELYDFPEQRLSGWNQDHVERKRDLTFSSVMNQLTGGRQRLLEEIAQVPDEALMRDGSRRERLVRSVLDHDREHWHDIAAKLAGMEGAIHTGPGSIPEEVAPPA